MKKGKTILDLKGRPITLNKKEKLRIGYFQKMFNALGYEADLTTLTTIFKKISEQKFYEVKPSDYVPVLVGDGAYQEDILTYTSVDSTGDFEKGIINTASDDARLAMAGTGVRPVTIPIAKWAKGINWSILELEQATQSGKWNPIEEREKARKRNWDLGIQRTVFLGTSQDGYPGLLTQTTGSGEDQVALNTSLITKAINSMTAAELRTFLQGFIEAYQVRANRTVYPTHMVVPSSDWNGLAVQTAPNYPLKTIATILIEALKEITGNPDFKVLPSAYAMASQSGGRLEKDRYALYRYDDESMRFFIPVDYTATAANTSDGFNFRNTAYAQFSGLQVVRHREIMYFEAP